MADSRKHELFLVLDYGSVTLIDFNRKVLVPTGWPAELYV